MDLPPPVRAATVADASRIAEIHVATWREAYRGLIPDSILVGLDVGRRTSFWQRMIAVGRDPVLVAEAGGSVVGFCSLIPTRDEDDDPAKVGEIAAIYVLPNEWRKGFGRRLCEAAVANARKRGWALVTLWVLETNAAGRRFYEAFGFRGDGATKVDRSTVGEPLVEVRYRLGLDP
jgi:GNAT superfamily N-acetyltransferase